jgi:RNA polymerase sigma-70 factor (ECF subfamily)
MSGVQTMGANHSESLVLLLTQHQRELYRYIFALVPREDDARDILQDANLALFRKADQYDPDKPFLPWAYQFAYLKVLKYRERSRRAGMAFSPDTIERLARDRGDYEPILEARLAALEGCLERLPPADRDLIYRRYQRNVRPDDLAAELGTSRRTLYRCLERVRATLLDCITRTAAVEPD